MAQNVIEAKAIDLLRQLCPHGHPDFIPWLVRLAKLHSDKNRDYAGGGPPLGNFMRRAATAQANDMAALDTPCKVALWDIEKQLDAARHMVLTGQEGGVETVQKRLDDVAVYAGLAGILHVEDLTIR